MMPPGRSPPTPTVSPMRAGDRSRRRDRRRHRRQAVVPRRSARSRSGSTSPDRRPLSGRRPVHRCPNFPDLPRRQRRSRHPRLRFTCASGASRFAALRVRRHHRQRALDRQRPASPGTRACGPTAADRHDRVARRRSPRAAVSTFQAVGGVSASLQALLRDRMDLPQGTTRAELQVTVSSPPGDDTQAAEAPRVNLFLYRVTENGALKNQIIPGQGHPSAYGHPPLSLVLHYLVTAYGATDDNGVLNETRAHFLLGSAMRVLHDHPVVNEALVTIQPPAGQSILHQSLRGEFERVKLCCDPVNLDDLSKVWTALTRPFRLSAAYTVSVVQIESRRVATLPAPVQARRVHVIISRRPHISSVYRTPLSAGEVIGDLRAHVLQDLTIEGQNFSAARTWVKLGTPEP